MADHMDRRRQRDQDTCRIRDEIGEIILAFVGPGAVAVPAQIGRDDMEASRQPLGYEIPASGLITATMDE